MESFEIRPLSDALGAEIAGLDVTQPVDADTAAALRAAWREHIVLLFRAPGLSQDEQLRFAEAFGEIGRRPRPKDERPEDAATVDDAMMLISNIRVDGKPIGSLPDGEMYFHHDTIFKEVPNLGTMLYAIEVPDRGGNTKFANHYLAWDALPERIRERVGGRTAHHVYDYVVYASRKGKGARAGTVDGCTHPVSIVHPATGRRALYVDRLMTMRIDGLPEEESDAILDEMFDIAEREDFVYEHVWTPGDLLLWDNLCSSHARTDFPPDQRRLLRRCQIAGDTAPAG
ncbi:MAG: TauD/TfdA family dioxygenase [Defluviicoccus sp.]|nr:TauD/TfdA family dioxygenase [Defluviicoccus sp.]